MCEFLSGLVKPNGCRPTYAPQILQRDTTTTYENDAKLLGRIRLAYCWTNVAFCRCSSLGNSDGTSATRTPTSLNLFIFASAVPSVPVMIAPACPILFSGGAALPATYAATGLVQRLAAKELAASSAADPPISPIRTIAL